MRSHARPANKQHFQAKVWVGGEDNAQGEYADGEVKAVVAYLRSMDNEVTSYGTIPTGSAYQLQQWRNVLPLNSTSYDDKWELAPLSVNTGLWETSHLRTPRPLGLPGETFTFKINKARFVPGITYRYKVISFEKLETKLHLMSRYPSASPLYSHIEDDLDSANVFANLHLMDDPVASFYFDDNPIVVEDTFSPSSGDLSIQIPLRYTDPEDRTTPRTMSDFLLCIYPE